MTVIQHAQPSFVPPERHPHDLSQHLHAVHQLIALRYPFVDRIALALYDADTDRLRTFVSSTPEQEDRLQHYEIGLAEVPSLAHLATSRQSRLVTDISASFSSHSAHTAWLRGHGYRASYTTPIFQGDRLAAFLFYDSKQLDAFTPEIGHFIDHFSDLIAQLFLLQRQVVEGLIGTVQVAVGLAQIRDLETGQHLKRMAAYTRLMAQRLAPAYALTDEYIELVDLFAPLHDIGKVGIPDRILLKPGPLNPEEWALMKSHVQIGVDLIDRMGAELGLSASLPARIMRHIVGQHHERCDGSGYPLGLKGAEISLEGRLIAVADVYDALHSKRPYKPAWTPQAVQAQMQQEVDRGRLCPDCVQALLSAGPACEAIRARLPDAD